MSAAADLLGRLHERHVVEEVGPGRHLLTYVDGHRLDDPVVLELDDRLVERYVARLARTSEGGDHEAAVGLMAIHLEEEVGSALATGARLRAVGVRPSRITRRPEWFSDRDAGPLVEQPGTGTYEWRS